MLGAIVAIMLAGFITGALARLAVPGPDPMPIWLTIAIGLAGSWGGGSVAAAIWGWNSTTGVSIFGFIAAILLVIAYRRFYQGRPLTGPEAMKFPERGIGLDRFRERQEKAQHMLRQARHARASPEGLSRLGSEGLAAARELTLGREPPIRRAPGEGVDAEVRVLDLVHVHASRLPMALWPWLAETWRDRHHDSAFAAGRD